MTASDEVQAVQLPDGRRLAYAEYGPSDGVACIVLSGMPGSRLTPAWAFPKALLADRGVRLLCAFLLAEDVLSALSAPT